MKKILTWFSLLFLVLWSSRCTKDDGGDYFAGARAPAKLDRTEARMFFESNATDLRHVDFRMSDHERHESGGSTKTHSVTCLDEQVITPLWDEFRETGANSDFTTTEVPLLTDGKRIRYSVTTQKDISGSKDVSNTGIRSEVNVVVSKLVIQKSARSDEKRFFIATFVADGPCQRSIEDLTELTFYRLDERFSGLEILSEATGRYIAAYLHRDGKRIPVGLIPRDRAQSLGIDSARAVSTLHLGTDRMMLESYAYNSEWGGGDWQVCPGTGGAHNFVNGVCSACNMLLPTDVYPDYCGRCGRLKLQCVCCPVCHNFPCSCSHGGGGDQGEIITCTKPGCPDPYHCTGTCGGGSGGVDVPVSSLKTRAANIQGAAEFAVDEVIRLHGRADARCNVGVNLVFKRLSRDTKNLDGMRANDMVKHWRSHPDEWVRLESGEEAQRMANDGWFVVVGWVNPIPGKSGHVAVVVPGGPILTNAGEYVPACMDTGCEMRSKKQGLNYSFGKDKRPYVEFYYYK